MLCGNRGKIVTEITAIHYSRLKTIIPFDSFPLTTLKSNFRFVMLLY